MAASFELRQTTGGLGGAATATALTSGNFHNIFDVVSPSEASAGDTEYRAVDLFNTGDATGTQMEAFIDPDATIGDLSMGIEASPVGSTTSIANESTAPTGVTFSDPTSGSPLALPDCAAGSYVRIWLRRIIPAAASNSANDQATMKFNFA